MVAGPIFSAGSRCGDAYEIKRLVARGAAAEWYAAEHAATGAEAIVTCSRFEHIEGDALSREAFSTIADRIRSIPSARFPRIYEWGLAGDVAWIAAQRVAAPALGELRRYRDEVTHAWHVTDALAVTAEAQAILAVAASAGVLHGDLTPERARVVGMPEAFGVVLLDVGFAELFMLNREAARATPRYRSPEQLEGGPIDERSDIYSLGMCAYFGITQMHPYWDKAQMSADPRLLKLALSEMPASLSSAGYCPKGLRQLVEKAIQKDPEKRFQSWDEFEGELVGVADALLKDSRIIAGLMPWLQLAPALAKPEAAPSSASPSTIPPGADTRRRVACALAEALDELAQKGRAPGEQGAGADGSSLKGKAGAEEPASPEPALSGPSSAPESPEPSSAPSTLPSRHAPPLQAGLGSKESVRARRTRVAYLLTALLAGALGSFVAIQAVIERARRPLLEARSGQPEGGLEAWAVITPAPSGERADERRELKPSTSPVAAPPPAPPIERADEQREPKPSTPPVESPPPAPRVGRPASPRAAATSPPKGVSPSAPPPAVPPAKSPCSEDGYVCVGAKTE